MRHFRFLLAAFALMLTTSTFANFASGPENRKEPVTYEIARLLKNSNLIIEEDFTVKVIFKVTADKRISIQKVSSPNEEVNDFLMDRLNDQQLHGASWHAEKIYELPIKVQSRR